MSKIIERLQAIAYTAQTNPTILTGDDIAFAIQNIKSDNGKVAAQAYSTIGHIGLNHPEKVMRAIDSAFASLKDSNWEIREQAVLAIGRTGRADINTVKNRLDKIIQLHCDPVPKVRAAMLDACQSIAHAKAAVFKPYIGLFERMLDDPDVHGVREHAPDIFRIIGKYEPEMVERSLVLLKEKLRDPSPATRAHAVEAIRTIETFLRRTPTV
ncbi:HEAT repeat domain-containing protein [Treponema vincentii]|uniref:HEAT repeat domain-containing protein n=1 Tax=Treponema vincentii TaxID=69710 RepID=UPI0035F5593F